MGDTCLSIHPSNKSRDRPEDLFFFYFNDAGSDKVCVPPKFLVEKETLYGCGCLQGLLKGGA